MHKSKDLIGKTIVQQQTGDKVAIVYDVIFDAEARKVLALLIETGGWFRDARIVPWSRVTSIGDVILVRGDTPAVVKASESEVAGLLSQDPHITGVPIVSDTGEKVGTVGDLLIDDRGEVQGYEVKQGRIHLSGHKFLPVDQVRAVGPDAVIAATTDLPSVKKAQREAGEPPAADH
jgi:uncharacterized protein YrrD